MTDIMAYPQHYDSIYRIRIIRHHADSPEERGHGWRQARVHRACRHPCRCEAQPVHPTGVTYHSHTSLTVTVTVSSDSAVSTVTSG